MRKADLKTGMVVELRNGQKYMVLIGDLKTSLYGQQSGILVGSNTFLVLSKYSETLKRENYDDNPFDIIKVFTPDVSSFEIMLKQSIDNYLVWKRDETNWNNVPVDTKVFVKDNIGSPWYPRHFAKFENGIVYVYYHGHTSFTDDGGTVCPYKYAKLA